ncbi:acyl-CoA dehydrogenase family protein [Ureibacillus chungkukjangi]|uniref:Alkylation response protein AidB-like acyl-CoA dehydrogenase n=1 Tax=Ureibacillus chungkukjangi TaxID=1202712 RepID=A0A318TPG7_9BACL|nr:acyl-CoA dehydrogenase family protein [Ureibacillus chungkukjangi]PYF05787.1 alkylation response protein AidB-like acyl-CoA dehydrogenase [Ureibacillus chungkukjangi]
MEQTIIDTKEMLVERANGLIPMLRENGLKIDQTSELPEVIIEKLRSEGLLKVLRPQMFGGYQTDMRTYLEVVTAISRGNGSAGWFVALSNIRDYMISYAFGRQALEDIFGPNHDQNVILAGNFKPIKFEMKKVEGGYLIEEAQWPFVSGSPHADWLYFGFPLADGNGGMEMAIMVVPRQDAIVLDDWNVMGLKGSGSNSVRLENVFVPEHRVSLDRLANQGHYMIEELREVPLYQTPFVPSLTLSIVAPALGITKGAMDLHMERVGKAGIGNTFYSKMNEAPVTHLQVAQSQLKIDLAELLLHHAVDLLDEYSEKGQKLTLEEGIKVKAEFGYVNQLCKESIDLMTAGAGSVFSYNNNLFQLFYRDFLSMHLHGFITPSSLVETYGRVMCGLEPNTYFV